MSNASIMNNNTIVDIYIDGKNEYTLEYNVFNDDKSVLNINFNGNKYSSNIMHKVGYIDNMTNNWLLIETIDKLIENNFKNRSIMIKYNTFNDTFELTLYFNILDINITLKYHIICKKQNNTVALIQNNTVDDTQYIGFEKNSGHASGAYQSRS